MSAAQFEKAVALVGSMPKDGPFKPSTDDQLTFYSHFKQAKNGDCTGSRPGIFDPTGRYKYDAWKKLEGTSTEDAQKGYVDKLIEILESIGDEQSKKWIEEIKSA